MQLQLFQSRVRERKHSLKMLFWGCFLLSLWLLYFLKWFLLFSLPQFFLFSYSFTYKTHPCLFRTRMSGFYRTGLTIRIGHLMIALNVVVVFFSEFFSCFREVRKEERKMLENCVDCYCVCLKWGNNHRKKYKKYQKFFKIRERVRERWKHIFRRSVFDFLIVV